VSNNPEDPKHIVPREHWAKKHLPDWRRDSNGTYGSSRCLLHDDSSPSMRLNLQTGGMLCHGCKWTGTITEYALQTHLDTNGLPSFDGNQEPDADGEKPKKKGRKPLGREIAHYIYRTANGEPLFKQVRFEPKDFRLQHINKDGEWKAGRNGIPLIPYRLEKLVKAREEEIFWVVEGEKDADNGAAIGLCTTTTPQGVNSFRHVDRASLEVFRGRVCVHCPDNHQQGLDYTLEFASALADIAAGQFILRLPGVPQKGDLSDWLLLNKGKPEEQRAKLEALTLEAEHCEEWRPAMQPRREIDVSDRELHDLSEEALKEILRWNDPPQIFTDRAGQLIRVQRIAEETNVAPVDAAALRGYLSESARWMRYKPKVGMVPTFPETAVCVDICLRHAARFPVLEEFTRSPVYDATLRLITKEGYDKKARLYADIEGLKLPRAVPQKPTIDDLAEAKDWLIAKMLGDFPFVDEASRAHSLAAILSPFVRQAISTPIPLHIIEAPTAGTGKSLLAQVIALPATGSTPASMSDPGQDEAEWRKRITSTLLKMPAFIFIDNVSSSLESDTLSSALTSTWWEDRILGSSRNIRIPQRATWLATGNNLHLKMDIARRTAPIRIDAKMADPWNKDGFKIPDIVTWCKENRPSLIWACLTMVRHWVAVGKPAGQRKMGSFEGYARTLGGILEACEIPGFLENYEAHFRRADTASEEWEAFITSWYEKFSLRPRTVTELASFMEDEKLLETVVPAGKNPAGRRVSLGKRLQGQIDRIYNGLAIGLHNERNANGLREYHVTRLRPEDGPPRPAPLHPSDVTVEASAEVGHGGLF